MKVLTITASLLLALSVTACKQQPTKSTEKAATENSNPNKTRKDEKMKVQEMTAQLFKEKVMNYEKNPSAWVFEGDKPVLIDFYATWCGPCKATAPILEEIAEEYAGKLDVYKVDVDKQEELAALFGIRSIPTFLFVPKEGKPTLQSGAMNKQQFEEILKETVFK